jgi:hypothetical protein
MSAIEITRQDLSISQLRAEAARTADAKQARRILAIAMVLDGHSRLFGRAGQCHGPADATRLGASLQHGWLGRALERLTHADLIGVVRERTRLQEEERQKSPMSRSTIRGRAIMGSGR